MNLITRLTSWGDAHHPKWLDFIRIILGLVLAAKGVQFINNMEPLTKLMTTGEFASSAAVGIFAHYIVFAHLLGGLMIAFGLLTRAASLAQIPILLGAVFYVNIKGGIFQAHSELWLSVLILCLLVLFVIEGSGKLSIDEWMRKNSDEKVHKHKWG